MEQIEDKKEMAPTAEIPGTKTYWGIAHGNRDLLRPCRVCVGLRSSLVDYFERRKIQIGEHKKPGAALLG
jgi:hypothetical protein